jgi:hypothetical protein
MVKHWVARAQLVSRESGASRTPYKPRSGSAWRQSHARHGIVWARGFFMWQSSCFGCVLEMRSAFIEVQPIREDVNAAGAKANTPKRNTMSWRCVAGTMRLLP